jgi:hypothetical protein
MKIFPGRLVKSSVCVNRHYRLSQKTIAECSEFTGEGFLFDPLRGRLPVFVSKTTFLTHRFEAGLVSWLLSRTGYLSDMVRLQFHCVRNSSSCFDDDLK